MPFKPFKTVVDVGVGVGRVRGRERRYGGAAADDRGARVGVACCVTDVWWCEGVEEGVEGVEEGVEVW